MRVQTGRFYRMGDQRIETDHEDLAEGFDPTGLTTEEIRAKLEQIAARAPR